MISEPGKISRSSAIIGWLAFFLGFSLPLSTALDNLFYWAIIVIWLLAGDWQEKLRRLRQNPAALVIGLLLLLALAGITWSSVGARESMEYFGKYAALILALCLISLPLDIAMRRRAFLGFCLAIGVTFVTSYAFRLGLLPGHWFPKALPDNPAVFKLHITHGFFMAIGAYILLIGALQAQALRLRWGLGIAAAFAAANVFIVQGRTGYIVLATLLTYLFVHRFRWRGAVAALVLFVLGGIVAQQFPDSALTSRVTQALTEMRSWESGRPDDTSMGLRMQWAATSLQIIKDHPLFGVGTGGFAHAYRAASPEGLIATTNPHNQYLLTAAQLGLAGLLVLLALFWTLWRLSKGLDAPERLLARGLLLAYAVGSLFNSLLFDHAEVRFFAWSMGLLFCGATWQLRLGKRRDAG